MSKTNRKRCRTVVLMLLTVWFTISPAVAAAGEDLVWGPKRARRALETRITYSCVDKDIAQVLMELAEQAEMDIIKSPDVKGNVTAKVTDVPLGEALTNILAAHNYTYVATDNMVRVVPMSEIALAKEELVSKVYRVTYADANEVAGSLRSFISEKGRVAFNKGTNHIVVTDTERKIKAVDKFIAELDRETPQVLVEVRIYDITTREGFNLGSALYAANMPLETSGEESLGYPLSVTKTVTPGYTTTDTEITKGADPNPMADPHHVEWGNELISLGGGASTNSPFDRYMYQEEILTQVVPDITTTETTYQPIPSPRFQRPRGGKPYVGGSFDRVRGGTVSFSLLNDAIDLEFALSMLKSEVESKLLANPRILVLDNETANFGSIREIPYREMRQVAREDPITYTEFKDVGIALEVTPHVMRDGMLRVHVAPEFGILVSRDMAGVPTVDTRRADTVALVRNGQTIAIGGLRKRQTSKEVSKVPVLGDMPLIGNLFRSFTELEEINELVVFITLKIIAEPEQMEAETDSRIAQEVEKEFGNARRPSQDRGQVIHPAEGDREAREGNPELMMTLARGHMKSQRFEMAQEILASVIRLQPDNNTAYQYLGYCYLKLGDVREAIESYSIAIALKHNDWEAHRGLGVAYMLKARREKNEGLKTIAVKHLRRSLQIKPDQRHRDALVKMIKAHRN